MGPSGVGRVKLASAVQAWGAAVGTKSGASGAGPQERGNQKVFRTFIITVPEPRAAASLALALLLGVWRRRRIAGRVAALVLALALAAAPQAGAQQVYGDIEASQGVVSWTSEAGMGYRVQRSLSATPCGPWMDLPQTFYGTGECLAFPLFDGITAPSTPASATLSAPVVARLPVHDYSVRSRRDGSAVISCSSSGRTPAGPSTTGCRCKLWGSIQISTPWRQSTPWSTP